MELRVVGSGLDPETITRETGLQPCRTSRAASGGGDHAPGESLWGFDGGAAGWESLEEALEFLLDQVVGQKVLFARYALTWQVVWWCGHVQASADGGPVLSARLLQRLGAFGAALFIDTHVSNPSSAAQPADFRW